MMSAAGNGGDDVGNGDDAGIDGAAGRAVGHDGRDGGVYIAGCGNDGATMAWLIVVLC